LSQTDYIKDIEIYGLENDQQNTLSNYQVKNIFVHTLIFMLGDLILFTIFKFKCNTIRFLFPKDIGTEQIGFERVLIK